MDDNEVEKPIRILPDGRGVWVYPLTFGRARLCVGTVGLEWFVDSW